MPPKRRHVVSGNVELNRYALRHEVAYTYCQTFWHQEVTMRCQIRFDLVYCNEFQPQRILEVI